MRLLLCTFGEALQEAVIDANKLAIGFIAPGQFVWLP